MSLNYRRMVTILSRKILHAVAKQVKSRASKIKDEHVYNLVEIWAIIM